MIKVSTDRKYSAIYNVGTQGWNVKVRSNESGVFIVDLVHQTTEQRDAIFKKYNCTTSDLRNNLYSGATPISLA
jgi:hypothetical protein